MFEKAKQKLVPHLKYASYVFRHKWYVLLEAQRLGILKRGLLHDWSKFLPDEWFPYVANFYGTEKSPKIYYDFNVAWLKHIHRNPHHWQHYLLHEDEGNTLLLNMPEDVIREMVADWIGASRSQGYGSDINEWLDKHINKQRMSYTTKERLYVVLGRYDLLLDLFMDYYGNRIPKDAWYIGLEKDYLYLLVENLDSEVEYRCFKWFETLEEKRCLKPGEYRLVIYDKESAKTSAILMSPPNHSFAWREVVC